MPLRLTPTTIGPIPDTPPSTPASPSASSNYNALQTSFVYRLTYLQLNVRLHLLKGARAIRTRPHTGNLAYGFDSNIGFQNPRNPAADYGRPSYDRTNVFIAPTSISCSSSATPETSSPVSYSPAGELQASITVQSGFTTPVSSELVLRRPRHPSQPDRSAHPQLAAAARKPSARPRSIATRPSPFPASEPSATQSPASSAGPRKSPSRPPSSRPSPSPRG